MLWLEGNITFHSPKPSPLHDLETLTIKLHSTAQASGSWVLTKHNEPNHTLGTDAPAWHSPSAFLINKPLNPSLLALTEGDPGARLTDHICAMSVKGTGYIVPEPDSASANLPKGLYDIGRRKRWILRSRMPWQRHAALSDIGDLWLGRWPWESSRIAGYWVCELSWLWREKKERSCRR